MSAIVVAFFLCCFGAYGGGVFGGTCPYVVVWCIRVVQRFALGRYYRLLALLWLHVLRVKIHVLLLLNRVHVVRSSITLVLGLLGCACVVGIPNRSSSS